MGLPHNLGLTSTFGDLPQNFEVDRTLLAVAIPTKGVVGGNKNATASDQCCDKT